MQKYILRLFVSVVSLMIAASSCAQITPADAKNYVGKSEIVCGKVASTNYAVRSKGRPTFLNLNSAYPNQIFTVVIWGNDRAKFGQAPERAYDEKKICVTGVISSYKGVPEIVASDPSQIRIGN
jgi:hypothetical protein